MPIFFVAFSINFCLFFSPPQKNSRSMGRLPSFKPPITDEISDSSSIFWISVSSFSKSKTESSLIVSSLRVLGNIFVIVSEKVIRFVTGVDDLSRAMAWVGFSLPSSRTNLCLGDNADVDGVTGGVGGKIGGVPWNDSRLLPPSLSLLSSSSSLLSLSSSIPKLNLLMLSSLLWISRSLTLGALFIVSNSLFSFCFLVRSWLCMVPRTGFEYQILPYL